MRYSHTYICISKYSIQKTVQNISVLIKLSVLLKLTNELQALPTDAANHSDINYVLHILSWRKGRLSGTVRQELPKSFVGVAGSRLPSQTEIWYSKRK